MTSAAKTIITVEAHVNLPAEKTWAFWTDPRHITGWNAASEEWHTPYAKNDLRAEGRFIYRMEAKDGSFGFDFGGTYLRIDPFKRIEYLLGDQRKVTVEFTQLEKYTRITESFEAEDQNPVDLQRAGWQSILNNFKRYAEAQPVFQSLHFETLIDAPADVVFKKMLEKATYEEWTKSFSPSSTFEGSWEKGSKINFTGEDDQGNKGGMVSQIRENIPNKFISIEHLGVIVNQEEITEGPLVREWAGAFENYTFIDEGEKTLLQIDLDSNPNFIQFILDTWPRALEKLKALCED